MNIPDIFDIAKLGSCHPEVPIMEARVFIKKLEPLIKQCYDDTQFATTTKQSGLIYRFIYDCVNKFYKQDYIMLAAQLAKAYNVHDTVLIEQAIASCFVYRYAKPLKKYNLSLTPEERFRILTQHALTSSKLLRLHDGLVKSRLSTAFAIHNDIICSEQKTVGIDACQHCKFFQFAMPSYVICGNSDAKLFEELRLMAHTTVQAADAVKPSTMTDNMQVYAKYCGLYYEPGIIYETALSASGITVYLYKGEIVGCHMNDVLHTVCNDRAGVRNCVLALAKIDSRLFKKVNAFKIAESMPAYATYDAKLPDLF
jgi:hypothetical protein